MNNTNTVHEQVSALADGHLRDDEFAHVIGKVSADDDLRATWQTYHLVGDVLRSGVHATCSDTSLFLSRLQGRLAAEPMVPALTPVLLEATPVQRRVEAANEPVFRWKLVAGAASLAAAAAIGWNWVGTGGPGATGAQLAAVQPVAPTVVATALQPQLPQALTPTKVIIGNGNPQIMLRDPRLDQLLEAHQQAGGASQMPSGFLRNATFERPSR
ncbi:sigma-E factor negative regulatory protein [Variovorax sp. GT1P44]|uniref:sigma-E factor negative regulatory protein n=1 Tax=Variovorax sp. GT1P44 TaxID=3443742 RepID=UPI003F48FBBD